MKPYPILVRSLLVAGLTFGAYGCKDFVDLEPQDVIPVGQFYKTEADIRGALNGTYGSLRTLYNTYYAFAELPSDNARTFGESDGAWGAFDKLSWATNNGAISTGWIDHYRTIAAANILLARIDAVPFASSATKAQYVGEAQFLRALMYFNLVRIFGDVPLVLTEIETEAQASGYVRAPAAKVYEQIEADLVAAGQAGVLPAAYTGTSVGRATNIAAKALLGKVYLQQKKWALAEAKLAEVLPPGPGLPVADITNVFGLGKDNNPEIVFAVQYVSTGTGEGNSFVHNFAPQGSGTAIVSVNAGSTCVGTRDLFVSFEAGDKRKDAFIGTYVRGTNTYYWAKKFIYNVTQLNEGDNDWPILRYADVVLMYAEALNNNGKTALAIPQLNRTRTRAGLASKPLTLSTADTQLAIEQERRVEFCFEGQRWYDLIRWEKEMATLEAFKIRDTPIDASNATIRTDAYRRLFPIPDREVKINTNLTQNPGY